MRYLWLFTFLFAFSCSKNEDTFHITGKVDGMKSGRVILEKLNLDTNGGTKLDSAEVKGGTFEFKGTIGKNSFVDIKVNHSVKIPFFLEKDIKIDINTKNPDSSKVIGGAENLLFSKHQYAFDKKQYPLILKNGDKAFAAFSAYYLIQGNTMSKDSVQNIVNAMKGRAAETEYFPHLKKVAEAVIRTSVGENAPDFTSKDVSGKSVKLSDLKGKNIMLEFWASWCGPCRKNNPKWQKIYEKYKSKDFEMLSVSFDEAKDCDKWKEAIVKDKMTWIHLSNCTGWNEISDLYGIKSVPATFLIDKNGKILAKNFEPENFENLYKKLIK